MNLSALFIKRPVTTTLLLVGILVVGVMAYRLLPISDLPVIDFPTVQVSAGLPGASPETMASSVALPLEKQFSTIAGLTAINSNSSLGNTNITLQFDLSRNIDAAAQDVQAVIAKTTRALPPGMPAPPSLQKQNPTDQPVLYMVLQSDTLPMSLVDEQAQTAGAAAVAGERRGAGQHHGLAEERRSRRRRPADASPHTGSASTKSRPRSPPRTSTCRPARCTATPRTSWSRPKGSC